MSRPSNWTDTYTIEDEWGGHHTYYADGTFMGYSGHNVSSLSVIRLVLNLGDESESPSTPAPHTLSQVGQEKEVKLEPGPTSPVIADLD